ncbi:MAG: AraC family transcriptional regulator [Woeseiaceae bacterium]|nr:AraC family transcriptional regulator [Woeseiaceae bacterium]
MEDRLVWLLKNFELRAQVFQAGTTRRGAMYPPCNGVGYLHLIQNGLMEVRTSNGKRTVVDQPCALLLMSPALHTLHLIGESAFVVCATFEFGLGAGNPLQKALPELFILKISEAPDLENTICQLFVEADGNHCGREAILDRLCEVVLVLMLRDLMDQQRLDVGLLAGLADRRLARAINAIHARPAEDWTLESLARVAGMSRARFAAHFRDVVGMTPGAYLSEWRLGLAQSMLLRGRPLKMVAGEVGYGSPSALSRVFAVRCGMPPTAWLRSRQSAPVALASNS